MKLRNKKTGEIVECLAKISFVEKSYNGLSAGKCRCFDSIDLLNEEWEDYEEPKRHWIIDTMNDRVEDFDVPMEFNKEIGNYFETKEEAEKAVEKLKAWKRLKDKGFRFQFWTSSYSGDSISFFIDWITADSKKEIEDDLDLLFGGEE